MEAVDVAQGDLGYVAVRNSYAEVFFETHDELKGVNGVETETVHIEKRQFIRYFFRWDLQHQTLHEHGADFVFRDLG